MASSPRRSFAVAREIAKRYEIAVGDWLKRRGWYVLPAYDYSGLADAKAPKFEAPPQKLALVLPDLLVASSGKSKWAEVMNPSLKGGACS